MKMERCFRKKEHPLIQREKNMNENEQATNLMIICRICTRVISDASFYACDVCEYYLHNSCTLLPDEISHSFHPFHGPLKLDKAKFTWCNSCRQDFEDAPLYSCTGHGCSGFDMDVDCALMPAISSPCVEGLERRILHFSHPHPLLLGDRTDDKDGIIKYCCNGCGSTCSAGLAYGCNNCNFFLHKSCAEFPRENRHPLHLGHGSLSLRTGREYFGTCFSCEIPDSGRQGDFFFKCCNYYCSFWLCWSCGKKVRRTIMYEGHDHNLHFVEKTTYTEIAKCNGYDGYCAQPVAANSSEVSRTKSKFHVCLDCDFKLHMLCGPLPATIKHECHIHCLTLVDSLVEDDYDEHYCDVCETERDPRIRFYYCEECKYFAHVHCLFSEIAKALTEEDEHRDHHGLELKVVGQDIWNLPSDKLRYHENVVKLQLTLKDLINKLTKDEKGRLSWYYEWDDDTSSRKKGQPAGDFITNSTPQHELMSADEVNETLKLIGFTYSHFGTFFHDQVREFYRNIANKLPFKSDDLELKTVNVGGGYMVPHTVGRVMRALLHNYGDISSDDEQHNRSIEWKSIVYFVLCEVLRRMATTLIIDVTKRDLREWYFHLMFAKYAGRGFEVDFACAHLEGIVRAFLGLQTDKLKDQIPAMLTKKIDKLEKEIAEAKSQLETCKRYSGSSDKSQFMIDCLKEGSDRKWKKACDQHLFQHRSSSKPTPEYWQE